MGRMLRDPSPGRFARGGVPDAHKRTAVSTTCVRQPFFSLSRTDAARLPGSKLSSIKEKRPWHDLRATAVFRLSGSDLQRLNLIGQPKLVAENAVEGQAVVDDVAAFGERIFPRHAQFDVGSEVCTSGRMLP